MLGLTAAYFLELATIKAAEDLILSMAKTNELVVQKPLRTTKYNYNSQNPNVVFRVEPPCTISPNRNFLV